MEKHFDWVQSSVIEDIDVTFSTTFCPAKDSHLQLHRSPKVEGGNVTDLDKCAILPVTVTTQTDLEEAEGADDTCQVFSIGQRHSYSRLFVARELFSQLLKTYSVFDRFWDFILPFSFKTRESDISYAPIRFRRLGVASDAGCSSYECAYGFRFVELNRRTQASADNPNYDPWSVRQSAVYQQYDKDKRRTMFILITPSESVKKRVGELLSRGSSSKERLNAFNMHCILLGTLHENWRLYLRTLEGLVTRQSDRVVLAQVQNEAAKLSPLTDFAVNFIDRQHLKMMEDKVLDLQIIFSSLEHTLTKLKEQCQKHCLGSSCQCCTCSSIIEEFDEQIQEVQVNLRKAKILHKRIEGTAQLLSDLLDYENAQIAHLNERALNGLVKESKEENSKMRILSERSTADAAAVKILTVITLIYLPMTVVANFFSSQLIRVDADGHVSVISDSWWFAVIAVPLTILTFLVWRWRLVRSTRSQNKKQSALLLIEKRRHKRWYSWNRWALIQVKKLVTQNRSELETSQSRDKV